MAGGYQAQPRDNWEALLKRLADLEKQIAALRGTAVVSNTTIGAGGNLVVAGGNVNLLDTDGSVLFSVGNQVYGDRGVTINRDDGTTAFIVRKAFSALDTKQAMLLLDSRGRIIGGDAALSNWGFDNPQIPLVWRPVDNSDAKTTTSGSFTALFEMVTPLNNPACPFTIQVTHSNSVMTSEWQVWHPALGVALSPFFASPFTGTVPAATITPTRFTSLPLGLPDPAFGGEEATLQIRCRVASGAGTVTVSPIRAYGRGY